MLLPHEQCVKVSSCYREWWSLVGGWIKLSPSQLHLQKPRDSSISPSFFHHHFHVEGVNIPREKHERVNEHFDWGLNCWEWRLCDLGCSGSSSWDCPVKSKTE
ncbi:hypothetical protein Droror1_Dr00006395 [Drosera rotundifolia]